MEDEGVRGRSWAEPIENRVRTAANSADRIDPGRENMTNPAWILFHGFGVAGKKRLAAIDQVRFSAEQTTQGRESSQKNSEALPQKLYHSHTWGVTPRRKIKMKMDETTWTGEDRISVELQQSPHPSLIWTSASNPKLLPRKRARRAD